MKALKQAVYVFALVVFALAGSAVGEVVTGQSVVGGAFKMVGDIETFNNSPTSDWNAAIAEEPTVRLDGSAGAILLGAGDTTTLTWSLTYASADTARLADSDAWAWGAGDDLSCASDGTNVDCTIGTLLTFGDGGATNYLSIDLDGDLLVVGSGSITMNDSVELLFGTAGAESEIASDGTDTIWTISSGDLVLGTDVFLTRLEGGIQFGAISTFTDEDATPDVSGNTYWNTNTTGVTILDFDGSGIEDGQLLIIVSKGDIVYDVDAGLLEAGSTDLTTATGDITWWIYDGTDWILLYFTDQSDDLFGI